MKLFGVEVQDLEACLSMTIPFILALWFFYSQRANYAKTYFDQIDGIYANFTESIFSSVHESGRLCGLIMNIKNTDDKGFFTGEIDYGERVDGNDSTKQEMDGVYTFYGKLNFRIYIDKMRHPLLKEENRTYLGRLYIIDRLDIDFSQLGSKFVRAEYSIVHYRDMQVLQFKLTKRYSENFPKLPNSFTLYKSYGLYDDPYKMVKANVFQLRTRVDK